MPGDWTSVSTTPTRFPFSAVSTARLAEMFDLPVPPRNEWTETIFDTRAPVRPQLRSRNCRAFCCRTWK
jgi:hypothetical protein